MAVFVTLIATFDVRRVLLNVTPQLVREPPRLLTFGLDLGPGLVLILTLVLVSGLVGLGYRNLQQIRERR